MNNWVISNIGESCDFFNGKAHEKIINENGQYIVINSKFISSNGEIFKKTNDALFPLFKEDIVFVMSDVPNGKALAKCFIVDEDDKYTLNQRICCIRSDKFENKFLFYQLNRHPFLLSFNNGENQTNLRKADVLNCPLYIPERGEQKNIITTLDNIFEGIDEVMNNTKKNLTNARKLFESYLNKVFTQKGEKCIEKTLKEISLEFGRGKSKHRPRNDKSLYDGDYPFIQTSEVRNSEHIITTYSKTYNEKGLAQSKLWPKGTICITIAANIAETGILDFDSCFPDSIIGVVVNPEITTIRFVEYLLQSFKTVLQAKGKGSAQDNINMRTFENLKFPFPTLDKQDSIVASLDSLMNSVQELEKIYQQKLNALNELKQSILQKAFTGELTKASNKQQVMA